MGSLKEFFQRKERDKLCANHAQLMVSCIPRLPSLVMEWDGRDTFNLCGQALVAGLATFCSRAFHSARPFVQSYTRYGNRVYNGQPHRYDTFPI